MQRRGRYVHITPAEGEQLALPQPRRYGEHIEGFEPVATDDFEEASRFLG
jgi:hypothetical protein